LPALEHGDSFSPCDSPLDTPQQSARVLDYVEWKNKMVKEPNGTSQDDKPSEKLDDREKMLNRLFTWPLVIMKISVSADFLSGIMYGLLKIILGCYLS
jgi:hypothetical protein